MNSHPAVYGLTLRPVRVVRESGAKSD